VYERLSEQGQETIRLAEAQAREMGHAYLGTEHLLLGLLAQRDTSAGSALQYRGVELGTVRAEAERIVGLGDDRASGSIPLTPLANRALERTLSAAEARGHELASAEDLLLGLTDVADGLAARILLRLDVSLEELRKSLTGDLGPGAEGQQ
jgi:ATP-dependent Clp protease ATP-binding subunit ClpC